MCWPRIIPSEHLQAQIWCTGLENFPLSTRQLKYLWRLALISDCRCSNSPAELYQCDQKIRILAKNGWNHAAVSCAQSCFVMCSAMPCHVLSHALLNVESLVCFAVWLRCVASVMLLQPTPAPEDLSGQLFKVLFLELWVSNSWEPHAQTAAWTESTWPQPSSPVLKASRGCCYYLFIY